MERGMFFFLKLFFLNLWFCPHCSLSSVFCNYVFLSCSLMSSELFSPPSTQIHTLFLAYINELYIFVPPGQSKLGWQWCIWRGQVSHCTNGPKHTGVPPVFATYNLNITQQMKLQLLFLFYFYLHVLSFLFTRPIPLPANFHWRTASHLMTTGQCVYLEMCMYVSLSVG